MSIPVIGRLSRTAQFVLVIVFAFTLPVVSSLLIFSGTYNPSSASAGRVTFKILYELAALGLLWLVLSNRDGAFIKVGLSGTPSLSDISHSVLLFVGAFGTSIFVYYFLQILHHALFGTFLVSRDVRPMVFGLHPNIWFLLFIFLNAFYEELIVRAFLITEAERIFHSTGVAVFMSVLLQGSYHLYQGLPSALSLSAIFAVFSAYYIRTRRILPVVLAHLYLDLYALLFYVRHIPHN